MSDQNHEKEQLVTEHIGLVHMVLKRYWRVNCEREELFQVGCEGLVKAANRFDDSLGYAFSTYAVPVISGEIARFLRDDGILHVNRSAKEKALCVSRAREKLEQEGNSNPTLSELCRASGLSQEEVLVAMEAKVSVENLDRPMGEKKTTLSELLASKEEQSSYERVEDLQTIRALMKELSKEQKRLIYLRYVLGKSQVETARILKKNQSAISRDEKKILLHLRSLF